MWKMVRMVHGIILIHFRTLYNFIQFQCGNVIHDQIRTCRHLVRNKAAIKQHQEAVFSIALQSVITCPMFNRSEFRFILKICFRNKSSKSCLPCNFTHNKAVIFEETSNTSIADHVYGIVELIEGNHYWRIKRLKVICSYTVLIIYDQSSDRRY